MPDSPRLGPTRPCWPRASRTDTTRERTELCRVWVTNPNACSSMRWRSIGLGDELVLGCRHQDDQTPHTRICTPKLHGRGNPSVGGASCDCHDRSPPPFVDTGRGELGRVWHPTDRITLTTQRGTWANNSTWPVPARTGGWGSWAAWPSPIPTRSPESDVIVGGAIDHVTPELVITGGGGPVGHRARRLAQQRGDAWQAHPPAVDRWEPTGRVMGRKRAHRHVAEACTHLVVIACRSSGGRDCIWTANLRPRVGRGGPRPVAVGLNRDLGLLAALGPLLATGAAAAVF